MPTTPVPTSDRNSQNTGEQPFAPTRNTSALSSAVAGHIPVNQDAVPSNSITAESSLDVDYTDDNLQQAIDSLTQSFEGEVVQLDNDLDGFDEEDISLAPEVVIPLDRPDVDEYDDDW